MKTKAILAATFLAAMSVAPAQAALLGTTASLTPVFGNGQVQPTLTATVGAATEFPTVPSYGGVSIDIANATITVFVQSGIAFAPGPFNGFRFTFSDTQIDSVDLDTSSTLNPTGFTLAGNLLSLDFAGLDTIRGGGAAVFNVGSSALPVSVPEPMSLALLGLGLVGIVAARRRA